MPNLMCLVIQFYFAATSAASQRLQQRMARWMQSGDDLLSAAFIEHILHSNYSRLKCPLPHQHHPDTIKRHEQFPRSHEVRFAASSWR
jgi:hypothetical protein